MATELEKIIADKEQGTPTEALSEESQETEESKEPEKSPEEIKREEHLANLGRAVSEAETRLKEIRKETKKVKAASIGEEEDDLPKFDEQDPNVRALDRRVTKTLEPIQGELDKEKAEVRRFALEEFLNTNPALARDSEKVKEMMGYYEKIRTASERTREGVLLDLRKAAAVVFSEDILKQARGQRYSEAQAEEAFSAPAVGSGMTGYRTPQQSSGKKLSQDEVDMLRKWGMTPQDWQEDYKKYTPK